MLYDRHYMRADSRPSGSHNKVLTWLIISNIAVFVLNLILQDGFIGETFALSISNLRNLKIWTILSYSFLHSSQLHIIVNLLGLYFIGRILEPALGSGRFAALYFISVIIGGLLWLAFNLFTMGGAGSVPILLGASAGVFGILTYFCCMQPNSPITFLLFFIIPITLKPKWLLCFLIGMDAIGLLGLEIGLTANIAHSAHLGGYLGGFIAFWMFTNYQPSFSRTRGGITVEPPKWMKGSKIASAAKQKFKVNVVSRKEMQAEVDRILDKINRRGFGSLTLEEKETLDRAKEFLRK